jgi:hypothetical protein
MYLVIVVLFWEKKTIYIYIEEKNQIKNTFKIINNINYDNEMNG